MGLSSVGVEWFFIAITAHRVDADLIRAAWCANPRSLVGVLDLSNPPEGLEEYQSDRYLYASFGHLAAGIPKDMDLLQVRGR